MQSLCSSEDAMALLDHMETQYYKLQLQLYDIQAEILQCEELLLTAQLDTIRRQMTGTLDHSYSPRLAYFCSQDESCLGALSRFDKTLRFTNSQCCRWLNPVKRLNTLHA